MESPSNPAEATNNAFHRHQQAPNTQNQATHHQQHPQPLPNQLHQDQAIGGGIRVINQQPNNANLIFPISYNKKFVNIVSIKNVIVGVLQIIVGIVKIAAMPYLTSFIAAPIWCGILVRAAPQLGVGGTLNEHGLLTLKPGVKLNIRHK